MPDLAPSPVPPPSSIFDLEPLEHGGEDARQGFGLQDHVAAGLCLEMLLIPTIREIWCETHDDIAILFEGDQVTGLQVEFVQVKAHELDQLWSVAKLISREPTTNGKALGKSIVEKSLANDRCKEPCCFRIVTARPVNADLEALNLERGCEGRKKALGKLKDLTQKLIQKLGDVRSPNNHDVAFWVDETFWQIAHGTDAEKNRNLQQLHKAIDSLGTLVAPDQLDELYMRLVRKVWDAGTARFRKVPEQKRIKRDDLIAWLKERTEQILHPAQASGKRLQEKMGRALLPEDTVKAALEQRRYYLQEIRRPRYLDTADRPFIEGEVSACLLVLRAKLDSGELSEDGIQFHSHCLQQLHQMSVSTQTSKEIPKSFLYGCMYNITDRCLHRFTRAEP